MATDMTSAGTPEEKLKWTFKVGLMQTLAFTSKVKIPFLWPCLDLSIFYLADEARPHSNAYLCNRAGANS